MYHCGPTVYGIPHIGNYRTSVMNDLLRRMFEYNGYQVKQVMNITDVDDKMLRKSHQEGISLKEVADKYEAIFLEGLKSLSILLPHEMPHATEYIPEMIELIGKLLESGVAYKANDGVYMSIDKVKNYGALAHLGSVQGRTLDKDHSQQRIANDEYDKENPHDFALWKFKIDEDGVTSWQAPFGEGRPGWHIECSAMSMRILGPTIDIHTGAVDLIFPHHTNEIAQSESATGKQFVNYWIHGAFMTMKDEKMTKSEGNVITIETLESETISPLTYRYWLLTAHYRSPVNFSLEAIRGSQSALIRLMVTMSNLPVDNPASLRAEPSSFSEEGAAGNAGQINTDYKERFLEFINDDLDMPKAVALVWDLLKDSKVADADKRVTILDFDRVLGLNLGAVVKVEEEKVPHEITALAEAREEARKEKDWVKADALRQEIETRGYEVKDTEMGFEVTAL